MASIPIAWSVSIDTKHDNSFSGTYDNISNYVINIETTSGFTGGQDAYRAISEPLAPPAQMRLTLANPSSYFLQEPTYSDRITNGDFTSWSGGNPTSWTVAGEVGTNPEVSQVGISEGHGGTGTGACNLYTTSGNISISQSPLGINSTYKMTLTIGKITSGNISVYNGSQLIGYYGEEGVFTDSFVATSTSFTIQNLTASCDVTIDKVTLIQTQAWSNLLRPGILVRFSTFYGVTTRIFYGKITEGGITYGVNPKSGNVEGTQVMLVAQDAMMDLGDLDYNPPLMPNATTGAVIQRFFDDSNVVWPYLSKNWLMGSSGSSELDYTTYLAASPTVSIETGKTTLTWAGTVADNGHGVQAQQYLRDVVMAEGGGRLFFQPRTATWVFHDRSHDSLISSSVATIDVTIAESANYIYGDDLINSIQVNYTAQEIGAPNTTLYTSKTNPVRVDANTVRKITGRYLADDSSTKRIGATAFQSINSPKTWVASTNADGTGTPIGNFTVSAEPGGTSVAITIDNQTSAPLYITGLTFKGTPLIWYDESVSYADPQSKRKYDIRSKQPLSIKMLDDGNFAYALCQYIVNRYSTPQARFDSITFEATLNATNTGYMQNRTIGDRITITSSYLFHNSDYVIIGEAHSVDASARTHKVTWFLKHLGHEKLWILDRVGKAELGVNTYLGL